MIISWHGDTCFTVKTKDISLVIDPYKEIKTAPKNANIVLLTKEGKETVDLETSNVFDWPGEYESQDISVIALQAWDKSLSDEEKAGKGSAINIFKFDVENIKLCHLGNIGHILKSDMIEELGDIDVLFINASDKGNLSARKAHDIVEQIDPRVVVLMGTGKSDEFLKEMGAKSVRQDKLKIDSKAQFQEEKTEFVVLDKE